ncbi:MAG: CRISPR-associated endonuclease Cas3'' [Candidatus Latescibacteria bacterium]|nr:CRISPR-associated endonuclease Cas3'' [Candidatus Latescibacterota bacterium]
MAGFYAHSLENDPAPAHWQELETHLRGVADKAALFAEFFASREWGYLAGLWHDLGKYQPEFQARLQGERIAVEHSGMGATYAFQIDKDKGIPLAFVIAGHHAGLANYIESGPNLPSPLKERLRGNEASLRQTLPCIPTAILQHRLPDLLVFLKPIRGAGDGERKALARSSEFWVRFLFSALVDADRLDTEGFLDPAKASLRGAFSELGGLRNKLDAYIEKKIARLSVEDRKRPINQARAQILNTCREAASQLPGFFSLTVPTGGGKTLSAMSFALRHAELQGLKRVIVVIPYTSIIEQNAQVYRQALGAVNVVEHHSNLDPIAGRTTHGIEVTRQHELACENWDASVIVTTSVQFFESLFANHPSRCRKLHNIARSVIILDEVQTLPPGFLLSILDALNELVEHYGCTVVLSTATPPALAARERFPEGLKNVRPIIADPKNLAAVLTRVEYTWPDLDTPPAEWLTLAAELAQFSQVLAIVHRRNDARILAQELQRLTPDDPIFHLSALMCPAHRSAVLAQIKETLGHGDNCRLISTQLVEAGVDVDFPIVYRALGGLDSMVQAAGRCNREGKRDKGRVVIFRAPTIPPAGTPRKALEVATSLLKEHEGNLNPDNPELFEDYFRRLYFAANLDSRAIQAHRAEFKFATVGHEFKLIEDGFTYSVVVPYSEAGERLRDLRQQGPHRETLRALQPFLVSVYPDAFNKLYQAGALEEVIDGTYALTRVFENLYDSNLFGLVVGDEPVADPSALMV